MPERIKHFAACGKVLLEVFNKGPVGLTDEQIADVREARKCVLQMILDLVPASEDGVELKGTQYVKVVLQDLHPEMNYDCNEKLIRDLAEICATFCSVEKRSERSARERVYEAKIFCDHMKDELNGNT